MSDPTRDYPPQSAPTADPAPAGATPSAGDQTLGPAGTPSAPITPVGLQRYELLSMVGQGGMGTVFRARDLRLNRDVAVKLLQDKYAPGSLAARRFVDESPITGQLQHPGIPPVHEVGELPDGRPFLVMKLIKGRTLADLLESGGRESPEAGRSPEMSRGRLIAAFEQVCQAVAYAHNHGVIHRDLKPHNVMVGQFGEVQVMDWGLAKFRTDARTETLETETATTFYDPRDDTDESLKTRAGSFLGTPAYMPPEQAIGAVDQIDERSDVFGLGAVLCVILTGQPPFVADTREATRQLAAEKHLEPAFARLDACPAESELVALCKRCLSARRDGRPGNAGEVAAAVHAFRVEAEERARQAELDRVRAEGERAKAETRVAEQAKRRRVVQWAGGIIAAVLLAGLAVSLWQMNRAVTAEGLAKNNEQTAIQERNAKDVALQAETKALGEKSAALQAETAARAAERVALDRARTALDRARTALRSLTDEIVVNQMARNTTLTEENKEFLRTILEQYEGLAAITGDDAESRAIRAEGLAGVGLMRHRLGELAEAEAAYTEARAIRKQLVGHLARA